MFLAAFRPLRIDASKPEVRAYLRTTTSTVLAGFWRRRLGVEVTTIDDDMPMVEEREASDAHIRAERVLAGLPERHRRILQLRFLHGHSIKEAAQAMGVTVANAKVLQHRALRMAAKGEMP